jgi:hypothetical protein
VFRTRNNDEEGGFLMRRVQDHKSAGHWVRHSTPAGRGLRLRAGKRVIDVFLFLITFSALVSYAVAHGAGR